MPDSTQTTPGTGIQTGPASTVPSPGGGKAPLNTKALIVAVLAMLGTGGLLGGIYYMKHSGVEKPKNADEAQIEMKEKGKKLEAATKVQNLEQAPLGGTGKFDDQGNFLGPAVPPVELPENGKSSQLNKLGKFGGNSNDSAISALAMPGGGADDYSNYSGAYKPRAGMTQPVAAGADQGNSKEERELLAASMLGYSRARAQGGPVVAAAHVATPQEAAAAQIQAMTGAMQGMQPGMGGGAGANNANAGNKESNYIAPAPGSGRTFTRPGEVADMRIRNGESVRVPEGKSLECVLVNNVMAQANQSPMIITVSRDFRSFDGRLLVPAGARLVGMADRVQDMNQERVFMAFNRIDFPDQETAWFPQHRLPEGLDPAGSLGVEGLVKRGIMKALMASIALGVVEGMGAAAAGPTTISTTTGLTTITPGQQAEAHVADNLNRFSERVLSRYMNMVPQITLRPGTRLRVYFTEDTIMSFYGGRQ
jgi:type IV secretory pathway VirB10-like protein